MDPKTNSSVGGRLTANKIHSLVKDMGMTLEEIAESQGMEFSNFLKLAKTLVGQKKFAEIMARSEANGKTKKKNERREAKKQNVAKGTGVAELSEEERQLNELRQVLETFKAKEAKAEGDLKTANKKYSEYAGQTAAAQAECKRIRGMLQKAEENLRTLQKKSYAAEADEADAQADIAYWHMESLKVEERIKELENSTIYLVHPKYPHALPKKGTFVSWDDVNHPNSKKDSGEELLEDPSWSAIQEMGYTDFAKLEEDINFAKLVLKYLYGAEDSRKCYILVEDQQMVALLKLQGIEVSDYQP